MEADPPKPAMDKANTLRRERADRAVAKVRDIRRNKVAAVPLGALGRIVSDQTGTIHPHQIRNSQDAARVLMDGANNSKLGGYVLAGWLKGARILSLTLEERITCPATCPIWDGCMGNNMHRSIRFTHGPALVERLRAELVEACTENARVLVRLHILGDFYSFDYLQFWAEMLDKLPGLHVFGFTAWPEDTPIGRGVDCLRKQEPDRFAVRTSGRTGKWGSFTLPFPTEAKMIGDAVVCPEQSDAMNGGPKSIHCGSCGICWKTGGASTGRPVAFVEH